MKIYLLKLWVILENKENNYVDFYLDVTKIIGWYIPDDGNDINLILSDGIASIKQEPHIIEYLTNEFVNKAVTPKISQ